MTADVGVDPVTDLFPLVEWALHAELRDRLDRPVERHPRHDLGIGELFRAATDLPDAFVRFVPYGFEMIEQRALDGPSSLVFAKSSSTGLIKRIHQLAIDIQLPLVVRGVANADRLRIFVA